MDSKSKEKKEEKTDLERPV